MARNTTRRLAQLSTGPKTYTSNLSGTLGTMSNSLGKACAMLIGGQTGVFQTTLDTTFGKVLSGTLGTMTSEISSTLFRIRSAGGKVIMGAVRIATAVVLGTLGIRVQAPAQTSVKNSTVIAPTHTQTTKVVVADDEQREVVGNPPWR